jgi:hypothetical protein
MGGVTHPVMTGDCYTLYPYVMSRASTWPLPSVTYARCGVVVTERASASGSRPSRPRPPTARVHTLAPVALSRATTKPLYIGAAAQGLTSLQAGTKDPSQGLPQCGHAGMLGPPAGLLLHALAALDRGWGAVTAA